MDILKRYKHLQDWQYVAKIGYHPPKKTWFEKFKEWWHKKY